MGSFIENLIVEFPDGKFETEWYDWIGIAVVAGLVVFGTIKVSKEIKKFNATKAGVSIETKN